MKLDNEFVVPAPIDQGWAILLDLERIAPCVPGAVIEGRDGSEYSGTMTVKLGPIVSTFNGTLRLEEADEAEHRSVMRAQARAARGQGNATATITSTLAPSGDGTRVMVQTELRVSGPLAQFGGGVMQDVSAALMRQFAECLAAELTAAPPPDEAEGSSAPGATGGLPAEGAAGGPPAEDAAVASGPGATGPLDPGLTAPSRRPAPDVLDGLHVGGAAILCRALPAALGIAVLLLLRRGWHRSRRG